MPISSTPLCLNMARLSRSVQSSVVQVLEKASGKNTSATGFFPAKSLRRTCSPNWLGSSKSGARVSISRAIEVSPYLPVCGDPVTREPMLRRRLSGCWSRRARARGGGNRHLELSRLVESSKVAIRPRWVTSLKICLYQEEVKVTVNDQDPY